MWFSPALVRRVHFHRSADSGTALVRRTPKQALVLRFPEQLSFFKNQNSSRPTDSETALVLRNPERLSSFGIQNGSRPSESRTALVLRNPEQLSSFGLQNGSRPSDSRTALVLRTPVQLSSFGLQNIPKQLSSSGFWNSMSRPHSRRCFHNNSKMAAKSKQVHQSKFASFICYISIIRDGSPGRPPRLSHRS